MVALTGPPQAPKIDAMFFAMWMPGVQEWIVIMIVGLILFGGRLPEVGKSLGRSLIEFRKGLRGLKDEVGLGELDAIRRDLNEAAQPVYDEVRDTAHSIQDAEFQEAGSPEAGSPEAGSPATDDEATPDATEAKVTEESVNREEVTDDGLDSDAEPRPLTQPSEPAPDNTGGDRGKPPAFGYQR